jgi:hypothetical protein
MGRAPGVWARLRLRGVHTSLRRVLRLMRQHDRIYNTTRLIERHGFRSPSAIRAEQLSSAALAA